MNKGLKYLNILLLVLVSLFGTFSNSLFHHHDDDHHHHHETYSCHQELDLFNNQVDCSHESHFEFEEEDCIWCDNYIVSEFYVSDNKGLHYDNLFVLDAISYYENTLKDKCNTIFNKGPPVLLF